MFLRLRAGYQKLLEDARKGQFDVVVAEALDRLSRDQEHVAALYKQVAFASVKLVTLAEGEISELHVGLKGTMNALFLKDLAQKVRRGLEGRVRLGRSGGGIGYGYKAVRRLDEEDNLLRGERHIDEAKAEIVRRIFREFVAGKSPRRIAKELNKENIPGPRGRGWTASTIHGNRARGTGILNNDLYVGRLVWNRQRFIKDPNTGLRVGRVNPEEDRIVEPVDELRIVSDDLWHAAKRRQELDRASMGRQPRSNRLNAFHRRHYLLSGLIRCGLCQSAYSIASHDRYQCTGHRNRGTCSNDVRIHRQEVESRVLSGLRDKLMAPELVAEFIRAFHTEINQRANEIEARYASNRRELAEIRRKIDAIVKAIEDGIYTNSTRDRLVALEQRKAELEAVAPVNVATPRFHPRLADVYRDKVSRLEEALNHPDLRAEAADVLRALIDEIRVTPAPGGELRMELFGDLAAILALGEEEKRARPGLSAPARLSLVAGEGFEPPTLGL